MTWQTGQATNYLTLLDDMKDLATSDFVSAMVIGVGGTGYVVGDIESIDGGTAINGHLAAIEVTSVAAGVVDGIRIARGGAYSVNPGAGATTSNEGTVAAPGTPGIGSGLTIDTTLNGNAHWASLRDITDFGLSDVALVAGGATTYAVNDILTLVGGTGTAATIRVLTVSAGVVLTISVETHGEYTVKPTGTLTTTGGGGTGATVTGTFVGEIGRRQLMLQGEGSGADEIYVGAFTYNDSGADAHNWELAGFSGYGAGLEWGDQPGISLGRYSDQTVFFGGSFILLANTTMNWWISVTGRVIKVFANPGTTYSSGYLGWLDPFHTEAELPNPLYIAGQTDDHDLRFSSSSLANSSICDPIAEGQDSTAANIGPGQFRESSGAWRRFRNSWLSSNRFASQEAVIYPAGESYNATSPPVLADDVICTHGVIHFGGAIKPVIPNTGTPGTQGARLMPSPNSTGDLPLLVPCTLMVLDVTSGVFSAIGELAGVFWVSAENAIVAEDTAFDAATGARYRIFQSGSRADIFAHFAVRED